MAKLTPLSKVLITAVVLGAVGFGVYTQKDRFFPPKPRDPSSVPPKANLPDDPNGKGQPSQAKIPQVPEGKPGCADKPEVRFYHWAWNAQSGIILANGGKVAAEGSLMCKYGVNLKMTREDSVDNMMALMLAFAEDLKAGNKNPAKGAHFIAIMGDGSAAFFKGLNDQLKKLGPEYTAVVFGSAGYSRGEDKFMGPPSWKENPQSARAAWSPGTCATATGTSP